MLESADCYFVLYQTMRKEMESGNIHLSKSMAIPGTNSNQTRSSSSSTLNAINFIICMDILSVPSSALSR